MSKRPLRTIFLLPILVAITLGFTVFAVYVDRVERSNRIADIDAELVRADAGNRLVANPRRGAPPAETPAEPRDDEPADGDNPVQLLLGADGSILAGNADSPLSAATLGQLVNQDGFATAANENFRVRVRSTDEGTTSLTALSLDATDAATQGFRRSLAIGGAVILALVAAVVWILVGSLTRPITNIAAAASRIADGELDTKITATSRSNELSELSDDLNEMLSQLRSTLEQRERSAASATEARDDMQRFLADMAHELRTPLTALKGYSDLHAGGMLDGPDDVDRAMHRIGSESERLYRLADDMLRLARNDLSTDEVEPVDVGEVAAAVVADLGAAYPNHQVTVDIGSGSNVVAGAPARIHQAILNLGANACQHSEPTTEILIGVSRADSTIDVRVVDHGPGIDPADRERIFLPFFRADRSRSRDGNGGAGLGLALTKQIVDQHRGTVVIEETRSGGATFVMSLPVSADSVETC